MVPEAPATKTLITSSMRRAPERQAAPQRFGQRQQNCGHRKHCPPLGRNVGHVIGTVEHEVVDHAENQRAGQTRRQQPGAHRYRKPPENDSADKRSRNNDGQDEQVCGWRDGHDSPGMSPAMERRDGKVRQHNQDEETVGLTMFLPHAQ
jgi:hypothetical protein